MGFVPNFILVASLFYIEVIFLCSSQKWNSFVLSVYCAFEWLIVKYGFILILSRTKAIEY